MKKIKKSIIGFLLIGSVLLVACGEREDMHYNGPQIANFTAFDQYGYFTLSNPDAFYNLEVGVLKPAEEDIKITLEVLKNTNSQNVTIRDEAGNTITSPTFQVTVKRGEILTHVKVHINGTAMKSNVMDTLQVGIVNPMLSGTGESHLISQTFVYLYPYCTFTTEEMQSMVGKYKAFNSSGVQNPVYVVGGGAGEYEVTVTSVIKDTLVMQNLFHITPTANPNPVFKAYVDRSTVPYKLLIKEGSYLFTYNEPVSGKIMGPMYTNNEARSLYGTIDYCNGQMIVAAYAYSPSQKIIFASTSTFVVQLTKK